MKIGKKTISFKELQNMKGKIVELKCYSERNAYEKYYVAEVKENRIRVISCTSGEIGTLYWSSVIDIHTVQRKKVLVDTLKRINQTFIRQDKIREEYDKACHSIDMERKSLIQKIESINLGFDMTKIPANIAETVKGIYNSKKTKPEIQMTFQIDDSQITAIYFSIYCYNFYDERRWHNPENSSFIYREYDDTLHIDTRDKNYIRKVEKFKKDMQRYISVKKKSRSFDYSSEAHINISDKGTLDYSYQLTLEARNPYKATPGNVKRVLQSALNSLDIRYLTSVYYSMSHAPFSTKKVEPEKYIA